jgi:acetyl esterase/lipase
VPIPHAVRRTGFFWRALALLPLALIAGCSSTGLINALVPRDGYTVEQNTAYGNQPHQTLDVYRPDQHETPAPIVVFFYGGEWQSGTKEMYLFVGQALAKRGFIVVIPDYRIYPDVRFPTFLEDSARSVKWTVDHAASFGGDPHRVYLMGHSAGAYIAAMLALDKEWLQNVGLDYRTDIRGTIGLAGPYDFLPLTSPTLKTIFGPEDELARTQPINFVDGKAAPMLLLTGEDDETVKPSNTTRLAERIRQHGGSASDLYYSNMGHLKLVGTLAAPLQFLAPTVDNIAAFIDQSER